MPSRLSAWLSDVPISDPVDRRNAPAFQVVMLLIAVTAPLLWLYRLTLLDEIPWRPGEAGSLAASLLVCSMAAFSFVLVRRGRFQWAVRQMLVVVAVAILATYTTAGLTAQRYEAPMQLMWLFVSGAMVGRRALWAMFLVLCAALFIGAAADVVAQRMDEHVYGDALISAVMYLVIAIVVDRTGSALRGSLAEATARGEALAAANVRLEEEIAARERAREQLLHAQRVEAVGRMASGVAHDFNHLLGLVLGYAARAKQVAPTDLPALGASLDGVESAARRGVAVAGKLTSFSRREVACNEHFDVADTVRGMVPMLRQTLGAGIVLDTVIPPEPLPVHFDRAQLELVVLNLAANAAHAMPDGGRARLAVASGEDGTVRIEFSDTGHGMSDEVAARALEPFFTTKPDGQGTGLGLSVASDVLGDAGGGIDVRSAVGVGTTVRLWLPPARSPAPRDSAGPAGTASPAGSAAYSARA
ncbi:MAG TPA: ATP-binding protein [Luteimonas sp.]